MVTPKRALYVQKMKRTSGHYKVMEIVYLQMHRMYVLYMCIHCLLIDTLFWDKDPEL